jgi:hypothetical protein
MRKIHISFQSFIRQSKWGHHQPKPVMVEPEAEFVPAAHGAADADRTAVEHATPQHTETTSEMMMRCLRGAGLSSTRNVARSKSACVTLGYSSRSSEVGEEENLFIVVCLAHGNNTDFIFSFGMHDHYASHAQQPKRDPTLFIIVLAIVFK